MQAVKRRPPAAARLALGLLAALALLGTLGGAAAAADEPLPLPPPTGRTVTVYVVEGRQGLRFAGPEAVAYGDQLRVVNRSNPRRVGPVTFSLVWPGALPRGAAARESCFAPRHICRAVAGWHGAAAGGWPARAVVDAGPPGWSTAGSGGRRGDSWFSGNRRGASYEAEVTAAPGTVLHFLCAVHPWLQISIAVTGAPPAAS